MNNWNFIGTSEMTSLTFQGILYTNRSHCKCRVTNYLMGFIIFFQKKRKYEDIQQDEDLPDAIPCGLPYAAISLISNLKSKIKYLEELLKLFKTDVENLKSENMKLKEKLSKMQTDKKKLYDSQEKRVKHVKIIANIENKDLNERSNSNVITKGRFSYDSLLSVTPSNVIDNQNPVVATFIKYLTENHSESLGLDDYPKNKFKRALVGETLMSIRNPKYVSPLAAVPAALNYATTGSRKSTDILSSLLPSGQYQHLLKWMFSLNSDVSSVESSGCLFYAFDNNQRLLRSYLSRNFNKQVVEIMTNIIKVNAGDCNIQFDANLHPSKWRLFENFSEENILNDSNNVVFDRYRENYLSDLYSKLESEPIDAISTEKNVLSDEIECPKCSKRWKKRKVKCDICKINMRQYRKENSPPTLSTRIPKVDKTTESKPIIFHNYEISNGPSSSYTLKKSTDYSHKSKTVSATKDPANIKLIDPLFVNPSSKEAVKLILDHIGKDAGIRAYGTGEREWCFIVCDGSPMTLIWQLIAEDNKFSWVVPITGLGHEEINMVRGFVEMYWDVIYKDFLLSQGYSTPKTLLYMKGCGDHHLSFDNLQKFRESVWLEILYEYLQDKGNVLGFEYEAFMTWVKDQKDEALQFYVDNVMKALDSVFLLRDAVRRNNHFLLQSARVNFVDIWFARKHTKYQLIICFEQIQRNLMPTEMFNFVHENECFSRSGRVDGHQGLDFVLEEFNKAVKQWISGNANSERWERVIKNLDSLTRLQEYFLQYLNVECSSRPRFLPSFDQERDAFRQTLRQNELFKPSEGRKEISLKKSVKTCSDIFKMSEKCSSRKLELLSLIKTTKYPKNRKYSCVKKLPVTEDEKQYLDSDERMTRDELKKEVTKMLQTMKASESMWTEFRRLKTSGTKDALLAYMVSLRNDQVINDAEDMNESDNEL